jgi:hypothetical protein
MRESIAKHKTFPYIEHLPENVSLSQIPNGLNLICIEITT